MVAQKDIAQKLGISRTAVSAILSGGPRAEKFRPAMRRMVLNAAEELGYQHNELARAIRTGRSNMIGFVTQNILNEYAGHLLGGIVDYTLQEDFFVKFLSIEQKRDASQLAKLCVGQCLAGVIIYDIAEPEFLSTLHQILEKNGIPLVIAGSSPDIGSGVCVSSDTIQGGRIAFEYLYRLGHRSFALPSTYSWAAHSRNLLRGFTEAAEEAGISLPDQTIWQDQEKTTVETFCEKIIREKVSACFCNTDFLALKLITGLQRYGIRVPEDISVMGRGNLKFCHSCCPEITSMDENLFEIGRRASALLLDRIENGRNTPHLEYVPHKLFIRNSTASASAEKGLQA